MFDTLLKRHYNILLTPDKFVNGHFRIFEAIGHVVDAVANQRVNDVQVSMLRFLSLTMTQTKLVGLLRISFYQASLIYAQLAVASVTVENLLENTLCDNGIVSLS